MISREKRVTFRMTDKEFAAYAELIGSWPKARSWTDLVHRALGYWRDAQRVTDLEKETQKVFKRNGKKRGAK